MKKTGNEATATPRRAAHTAWRQLADEAVLVDLTGHRMYGLNAAASFLWHALDGRCDASALARRMAGGQEVGDDLREKVDEFLAELSRLELTEPLVGSPGERGPTAVRVPEVAEQLAPPAPVEAPAILWQEEIRQAAGTCAFLPGQNPLCNQVPQS